MFVRSGFFSLVSSTNFEWVSLLRYLEDLAMQKVNYNLQDLRNEKKEPGSSFQQVYWNLDSLGNNLMAMLWLAQLALTVLQAGDNLDQAKKNLQDALKAGDCAKKLMRTVLNSPEIKHIDSDFAYEKLPDKTQPNHAPIFKIAEEFCQVTT